MLRFKEVSGNKPPNLSDVEVRRWHIVEKICLDKEEIEKMSQKKTKQKYLNGWHNSFLAKIIDSRINFRFVDKVASQKSWIERK